MSNPIWIRAAAVIVFASGLWTARTQQAGLEIANVRGALHVITGSGGNVGVLATPEGVILIDDKFDRNAPEILAKAKTVSDKPVRFVLNTHHHGDHTGGNAAFGATAGVIAHENARANMDRGRQPGSPHIAFSDETSLRLGGMEARAMHFGAGHTNGDAVVYFPQLRTIHTGDLFVAGAPFIDYSNGGSALEWDETLNSVLQLEFDTVIPGHGPVMKREDLTEWKENFETYRSRISKLAGEGKTADEVAKTLDLSDLEGWTLGQPQLRSLPGLLQELR